MTGHCHTPRSCIRVDGLMVYVQIGHAVVSINKPVLGFCK